MWRCLDLSYKDIGQVLVVQANNGQQQCLFTSSLRAAVPSSAPISYQSKICLHFLLFLPWCTVVACMNCFVSSPSTKNTLISTKTTHKCRNVLPSHVHHLVTVGCLKLTFVSYHVSLCANVANATSRFLCTSIVVRAYRYIRKTLAWVLSIRT